MQMVKRILFGLLLFFCVFYYFLPQSQELYYKLEHILKDNYNITISENGIKENPFGLSIENADIYIEDLNIGSFEFLDLKLFYLYDILKIKSIELNENIKNSARDIDGLSIFASINKIDNLEIKFSILKPYKIAIDINGSFGDIKGGIYFNPTRLFLRVVQSKGYL